MAGVGECALAVLPTIVERAIAPIKTHMCYALYCKTNLQDLKKEVGQLKARRDDLQLKVDEQRRNGKTILPSVTSWLEEVERNIGVMERQLEDDENRRKKKCFIGLCPDFITRYKLGKNAKKELATVADKLGQMPKLDSIAHHAAPFAMDVVPNIKGYGAMESRKKIFGDIMNALKVADVKMVGVHGMGGIGKTTLVKAVAREAVEQKLFDAVAIATVTQIPNTVEIQQEIGDQLGMTFEANAGERGRAYQLRDWLKEQKKILIVLDDLWETLDLKEVGISFQDEQDCKLLLTSREFDVLSTKMDVQNNFSIGVLEKQEAWDLFKKTAGGNVEAPAVHPIAEKISEKCGGLPVAIVTIAKALKDKSSFEWNDALHELQTPSTGNFTGRVSGEVYRALELSYQHLRSEELKSTFLLCSRMGYNASMDDLLKYAVGSGLFPDHVTTIKAARHRASSLVNELKNSCLLLEGNTSNQFSIHDVVRDVAISIAFRDHAVFVKGPDDVQMEGHGRNSQREYREIWLHGDHIGRIFEDVNCKKVEIFIFKSEDPSLEIRGEVFSEMEKLEVIGLTNLSFSSMPSSLHLLSNLHSLCIHQSSLEEISIIGQLKQLEVLSFVESTLKHLPEEIGKLKKLKLLDLTDCSELEEIAPNVISNLSLLQELYLGNSFHHWNIGENNASLMELEHLSHLINLDIHIPDSNFICKDLFSNKNLEGFRIFIGDVWDWHDTYETSRTLKLKFRESKDHLKPGILMLLKETEDLYLLEVEGVKNVVCELNSEGFPSLKHLHLHNSHDIQYVIYTMNETFYNHPLFPKLESLFLDNLPSIKSIHHGEFVAQSFEKLQILEVESCVELKNLFFFSTEQGVEVTRRGNMELSQLSSMCLKNLPNLRSFCSTGRQEDGEESIQLFDEKIAFPKLEDLQLESIPNIERLWLATTTSIQNLQRLEVKNCHRLEYIFSLPMVKSLVQLRHLIVKECDSVKEIIETEALGEETKNMLLFPKLEDIELSDLPKLGLFCTGCLIECPLLKTLSIQYCLKMETFISDCERREVSDDEGGEVKLEMEKCQSAKQPLFNEKIVFPSLARLHISGLSLEKIWNNQLEIAAAGTGSGCFYDQLRSVSIEWCHKLVNIFPSTWLRRFQRLEELSISGCDSLEEVFEGTSSSSSSSSVSSSFQLRDLSLSYLPKLKHIWNENLQEMLLNFHNLHTVRVSDCNGLKNLFPFSIATYNLQRLEKLEIRCCEGLEEMVAKAELGDHGEAEAETSPPFEFPQLTSLTLERLKEFRNFYRGEHSWECPRLKSFRVIDCPNVKVFGSKSQNIKGLLGSQHDQQQRPLFLVEKVIRSLEELSLDGRETTATSILWQTHLLAAAQYSYSKLNVLNLQNFGRESDCPVPFSFLQRLPNLETLAVENCSLKKLFSYEGFVEEEQTQRVAQLENLVLEDVDDIISSREQERLFSLFHHLKTLQVLHCHSLVNLASFSISFQNLLTLEVSWCWGLSNLITSSTAKNSFAQLVKLIISICGEMIVMVAKEEDEAEDDEIVFSKLEYLKFHGLPKLESFSSANYTFKFPSLKEVIVEDCPKMLIFSRKVPSTPKLQGVCWQSYPETKKCWQGNLNDTIREMLTRWKEFLVNGARSNADSVLWHHEQLPHFYSSFEVLKLQNFERKSDPFSVSLLKKLRNVTTLSIENSSLQKLFLLEEFEDKERGRILARIRNLILKRVHDMWEQDHPLIRLLHNLVTLQVESCDSLVTLVPISSASFQNLSTLDVSFCRGLSNLMTSSTSKSSFVQLVKLTINYCSEMTEIVAKDDEGDGILIDDGEIVFNKLEYLELTSLANLTSFSPTNYNFKFPSLKEVIVEACPKMLIFSLKAPSKPKLEGVCWQRYPEIKKCWEDNNLNATITKMMSKELSVDGARSNRDSVLWHHELLPPHLYSSFEVLKLKNFERKSVPFPSGLLKKLHNVTTLSVEDSSLQRLFLFEGFDDDEEHGRILACFRNLTLNGVDDMWEQDHPLIPLLRNLVTLQVESCYGLVDLAPFSSASFQNLSTLDVSWCSGLSNLITSSTAKSSFVQLVKLTISYCSEMTEIMAKNDVGDGISIDEGEIVFDKLEYLELKDLDNLISFSSTNHILKFPSLEEVTVKKCPRMLIFSPEIPSTPKLQEVCWQRDLEIKKYCLENNNLNATITKMVMRSKELSVDGAHKDANSVLWHHELLPPHFYSSFEVLKLKNFERKTDSIPSGLLKKLRNVTTLSVENSSLQKLFLFEGFDDEEHGRILACFRNLTLNGVDDMWEQDHPLIPLLHNLVTLQVESCYGLVDLAPFSSASFQNLSTLDVSWCSGLSNLITSSTAKSSFVQLVKLTISYCSEMTEIMAKHEVRDGISIDDGDEIVFDKLEYLELKDLGNLTSFSPTNHTFKFPSLEEVIVEACPRMLIFSQKIPSMPKLQRVCWQKNPEKYCWEDNNLNATITKMLMRSKALSVDGARSNADSVLWYHELLPPYFYSSFEVLKLDNFKRKSDPCPFGLLKKLHNVTTLSVEESSLQRLFLFEGFDDEVRARTLAGFTNLTLKKVHDMRNLWEQDHPLVPLLHNLVTLQVQFCNGLVTPAPISSAFFQNLSTLDVSWCAGLSNLITSSTVKSSFVQLVKLTISWCSEMTEIVAKDEVVDGILMDDGEIIFDKLEYLKLLDLEKLTSFSPTNYTFKFPSLKEVIVEECPKMMILSLKTPNTPKLEGVCWQRYPEIKKCWQDNNLNATVHHLYTEMVGLGGRWDLKLSVYPQLKERWHSQLPLSLFSHLKDLVVDDCAFVSNAISYNQLQLMNKLSSLHVRNCNYLERLFDLEGINAEERKARLLPKLKNLQLSDLPSLRHLFNMGSSLSLSITEGRGKETAAANKIVFPRLKVIVLDSLPNLTSTIFSVRSGILQIPLLEEISIENCPNLKTFVSSLVREQIPISVNEGQEYRLQKPDHDTVSFPKMKKLGVEWNDIVEIVCSGQFRADYFSKLEGLSLMHFPYDLVDFPSRFLQRFINLKKLSIKDASFKEIVFCEGENDEEKHNSILAQLEELKLSKLSKLIHLPNEEYSSTYQVYQKLKTLRVLECGMLDILIPSALSFHCLTTLEVSKCHTLLNLITSSSAKYMEKLKRMSITECDIIEEIVVKEENEVEKEVIFHNLRELRLECLPSLTSFHLGKCTLNFPSLKKLLLIECPKMKLFSGGVISTPKLEGVLLTKEDFVGYWEDDLNSTVQKLYFKMSDGVAQFKQPSTPIHPTLTCETTQVDGSGSTNVLERQVFEDLHTTGTPETSKDLPPVVATIFKNKETRIKDVSTESKITHITSSSQNDKENLTQYGQNCFTSIDSDTQIPGRLQKDPHASEKDKSSLDNVVLAVSFEQSNTIPLSPGTSIERVSLSTSASSSSRTSSQDLTVACADSSCPTSAFQRQVSEDLHSTRTIETCKDLPAVVAPIIQMKEAFVLTESKNTRIASSFQDFNTASNEKEDPTQGEKPSTSMGYKPHISLLVQKDSQTIEKDQPSPDNVMSGVSIQQMGTSPLSSCTSIEQVSRSTSASLTHRTSSQELTFSNAACSNTPTETLQSYAASSKLHRASIELIKKLVMKAPAEVVASSDYFLLMSSLKNLKNCASLNSQEQEIVRFYLENFPSLVTNNPFDEQKIDCTNSIKISIEYHKKELAELDISKKDLTIKINRLSAAKDELNKQLRAIQEEEDLLQAKNDILLVDIGSREGELEIEMDALLEAERHKIEMEDRASSVKENWAKLRNLSA